MALAREDNETLDFTLGRPSPAGRETCEVEAWAGKGATIVEGGGWIFSSRGGRTVWEAMSSSSGWGG